MRFLQQRSLALAGIVSVLVASLSMVSPAAGQIRGDLIIIGSASPNPVAGGSNTTYAVSVKNDSTVTATGVLVTIRIPQASPAPEFVKCAVSGGASGQVCAQSGGVVTTTYPVIKAHATVKVSVTLKMPGVSATFIVVATAHADSAIGGEEPRDGSGSIACAVLSDSVPVVFLPSLRAGSVSCGDNIQATFFRPGEDTVQLGASIGCAHSAAAFAISASGKRFDLNGFKIVGAATNQIKGSVGVFVDPGATGVTILGGGIGSANGIEYFDKCLVGQGDGLMVSDLRCFRARSAGIDIASDDVQLTGLRVDLVVAGSPTTTAEIPGGVGMHLTGRISVQDSIVRRAAKIGILADGPLDSDGTTHGVQINGNLSTSRVEASTGVGIQLDGAGHQVKNTYIEGDGDDGVSTTGVLINGSGVLIDGLEVVDFGGNGFLVQGDHATIKRSTVEAVGSDSFVVSGASAVMSGNSASKGQKGFVVSGADAFLDTNRADNVLGTGFAVSGDRAIMSGNSAKAGKAEGYVLSGNGGNYNTNKAETNVGTAFAISGNDGAFSNNIGKSERIGGGFLVTGTNNRFKTNIAENNKGSEWVIGVGNVDLGSNRKNGKTFSFTTAGGTFE